MYSTVPLLGVKGTDIGVIILGEHSEHRDLLCIVCWPRTYRAVFHSVCGDSACSKLGQISDLKMILPFATKK